jgi:hypothetical protein
MKNCTNKNKLLHAGLLLLFAATPFLSIAQENQTAQFTGMNFSDTSVKGFSSFKKYYISNIPAGDVTPAKIIRRINSSVAVAEITNEPLFNLLAAKYFVNAASQAWKLSSAAEKYLSASKHTSLSFILSGQNIDELLNALKNHTGHLTIEQADRPSNSVLITCRDNYFKETLLSLPEIIFADIKATPHTETGIIGYDRSFNGINAVDYAIPGANGKNIVVGVKEQKMEDADLDLYKRVLPSVLAAGNVTNHATVISSIIGGAGNSFYDGRGIANSCKFYPSSFSNLFADDATIINANKVTVQNHSYGTVIQQFYGAEAVSYDVQQWQNKNLLHVFSAGNSGTQSATDGKYANITGFANLTGNFKAAKNIITVAAIDNKGNIPTQSSAGPLYDGRLAPQITALGPNGTSDAAAVVSGALAVMQQVYADSNSSILPMASLLKAVMYNTADDIYTKGVDYKTGFGLLNSFAAIKALQQKNYDGGVVTNNQQWTKNITVPTSCAQLKVTLVWTDSAASLNNNMALLNDLDLEVKQINSGQIFKPWVLNTSANADSLAKLPQRKRDSLNTAEQVSIELPAAGIYEIKVTGTAVVSSTSSFNIAFSTDTLNTFAFTNPLHAADANREENAELAVKWKTFLADTNQTGNLYISYNNGVNWQLISTAYKIYRQQYIWPVKDTNSTALFKMETSFGNFLSSSFILSKVTRPVVDFVCADSVRFSWKKHVYAKNYKIFALTDSAYLKHIATVSDTFFLFKPAATPALVYAVEPVLINNLPAIRSLAYDVTLQGVKCFYKTLYYNLLDENKLDLIFEASAVDLIDSILFERVTINGLWLLTFGSVKANTNTIYHQFTDILPGGTTYLRVKIKLKTGAAVYTEIISVTTSGKKSILFYPNPVRKGNVLQYIIKQGISSDSKLELYDITGQLLKSYASMPVTINVTRLPAGIIMYKFLNNSGEVLQTGKLVIVN